MADLLTQDIRPNASLVIRIPIELFARVVWDNYEPRCGMPSFCDSERGPWKGGEGTGWEELTEEDRKWWIQLFTDCISCEADPGGENVDPARVGEIALILKPEVVPIATDEELELLREQADVLLHSYEISGRPDRKQPREWRPRRRHAAIPAPPGSEASTRRTSRKGPGRRMSDLLFPKGLANA